MGRVGTWNMRNMLNMEQHGHGHVGHSRHTPTMPTTPTTFAPVAAATLAAQDSEPLPSHAVAYATPMPVLAAVPPP